MLRPDEFRMGDLASAKDHGITLLLPRAQYEHVALMGEVFDQRYCVVLNGDLPAQAYPVTDNDEWQGILVPRVSIEVDEKSAFDPVAGLTVGAVVREGTYLSIVASSGPHPRVGRHLKLALVKDLPPCDGREGVGFGGWRIVIGKGDDKRELLSVNAPKIAAARAAALKT